MTRRKIQQSLSLCLLILLFAAVAPAQDGIIKGLVANKDEVRKWNRQGKNKPPYPQGMANVKITGRDLIKNIPLGSAEIGLVSDSDG